MVETKFWCVSPVMSCVYLSNNAKKGQYGVYETELYNIIFASKLNIIRENKGEWFGMVCLLGAFHKLRLHFLAFFDHIRP